MPHDTKVGKCVGKVMGTGKSKPSAIRICQASTGMSYKTGKKSMHGNGGKSRGKVKGGK